MRYYLVIGLSVVLLLNIKGQEYTPFDFENGKWYCKYSTKGGFFESYGFGNDYIEEEVKFYCDGDTVINDTTYFKLYYLGSASEQGNYIQDIKGYFGAIRNDTLNRRVYLHTPHRHGILFDFNYQIRDSIYLSWGMSGKIVTIDSVSYCNTFHRRYTYQIDEDSYSSIIEGIGSNLGLVPIQWFTSISRLLCYSENGNTVCDTCNVYLKSQNEIVKSVVRIFPNPTVDKLNITSEVPIISIGFYELQGRLIKEFKNLNKCKLKLDINQKGILMIRIKTTKELIVERIIRL